MIPENSSSQVVISHEGMFVTNEKVRKETFLQTLQGYRMARTSYGVSVGGWYWEAKIVAPEVKVASSPIPS